MNFMQDNRMVPIKSPKKLIEVALPLDAINKAAAREKSIRHGHPSTLHLWWARRPLAAARAVIFAQMVNDPGYQQGDGFRYGVNKEKAALERERLFKIIEDLVQWENTNNEEVLERARGVDKHLREGGREHVIIGHATGAPVRGRRAHSDGDGWRASNVHGAEQLVDAHRDAVDARGEPQLKVLCAAFNARLAPDRQVDAPPLCPLGDGGLAQ